MVLTVNRDAVGSDAALQGEAGSRTAGASLPTALPPSAQHHAVLTNPIPTHFCHFVHTVCAFTHVRMRWYVLHVASH